MSNLSKSPDGSCCPDLFPDNSSNYNSDHENENENSNNNNNPSASDPTSTSTSCMKKLSKLLVVNESESHLLHSGSGSGSGLNLTGIELLKCINHESLILHSNCASEQRYTTVRIDLMERIQILSNFARILPYRETVVSCLAQFICIEFREEIEQCQRKCVSLFARSHVKSVIARILFTYVDDEKGLFANIKHVINDGKLLLESQSQNGNGSNSSMDNNTNSNNNNSGIQFPSVNVNAKPKCVSNLNVYRLASMMLYHIYHLSAPCPI
jgi:hypothetical protein